MAEVDFIPQVDTSTPAALYPDIKSVAFILQKDSERLVNQGTPTLDVVREALLHVDPMSPEFRTNIDNGKAIARDQLSRSQNSGYRLEIYTPHEQGPQQWDTTKPMGNDKHLTTAHIAEGLSVAVMYLQSLNESEEKPTTAEVAYALGQATTYAEALLTRTVDSKGDLPPINTKAWEMAGSVIAAEAATKPHGQSEKPSGKPGVMTDNETVAHFVKEIAAAGSDVAKPYMEVRNEDNISPDKAEEVSDKTGQGLSGHSTLLKQIGFKPTLSGVELGQLRSKDPEKRQDTPHKYVSDHLEYAREVALPANERLTQVLGDVTYPATTLIDKPLQFASN